MSQKTQIDLEITQYPSLDVVLMPSRNFNPVLSHVPECLRMLKWT